MPPDEHSVRIPADVETPDKILAGLTARQVAILAATGAVLWLAFTATRGLVPLPVFAAAAFPSGAAAAVLALGRRDGVGLDRLLLAAIRHARSPRRLVLAPEGVAAPPTWAQQKQQPLPAPLRLPAAAISADGVIDLDADGAAVVCQASTVSFALRTPQEQAALVGVFGRWLNSLSGPAQIVVRAQDVDLAPLISGLRDHAPTLAHPELEQAAIEHADFLADLARRRDLLRRQVLLVLREPHHGRAGDGAAQRVLRRADEAVRALAAAGITVRVLPGGHATAVLAACCNPWHTTPAGATDQRAAPAETITSAGGWG
ncbi:PrgI family protein [Actinomadura pelletieri DSM 43383]|uniref:PrgI family protein n=1 Tax=Actinomadura pelletieri DSM 43383 TaxID=1120940 RepID=A0A495QFQ5_9ACTN|nr:PrgI family protein [Actinomadura pelletieri]RKS70695.1 PrgI family protein [Actinomadura pelletieri DSM 43383]